MVQPHDDTPMGHIGPGWACMGIRSHAMDEYVLYFIAPSSLYPYLVDHDNSVSRWRCRFQDNQSNLSLKPNYSRLRIQLQRFRAWATRVSSGLFVPAVHIRTIHRQLIFDYKYCNLTTHSSGQPPRNMSKLLLSRPAAA